MGVFFWLFRVSVVAAEVSEKSDLDEDKGALLSVENGRFRRARGDLSP